MYIWLKKNHSERPKDRGQSNAETQIKEMCVILEETTTVELLEEILTNQICRQ